jgi:hypothetical protein
MSAGGFSPMPWPLGRPSASREGGTYDGGNDAANRTDEGRDDCDIHADGPWSPGADEGCRPGTDLLYD